MEFKLLLICGLHRSGTTYVGKIAAKSDCVIVDEPFNEQWGVEGVPVVYPFAENDDSPYASFIDEVMRINRPWNKKPHVLSSKLMKDKVYALTGGISGLRWGILRWRKRLGLMPERVCLKDPFATLALPYIVSAFGALAVCIVRHPAAIHYSTQKQGWRFNASNLRNQPLLIERYGKDIPDKHWTTADESAAAGIALLWKMMVRVNTAFAEKDDRLLMIRHEDLCLDPENTARKIFLHLGLKSTPAVFAYVASMASGERAEAKANELFSFKRDSKALVDCWRGKLAQSDEKILREIVGDDILRQYAHW